MAEECFIPTSRGQLFGCRWVPDGASNNLPPIILLHDSLGCITLWRDFPEQLVQHTGRTVIAYDRLGFGRSDPHPGLLTPPDFITDEANGDFGAVIEHFEVGNFVALGHSVGGGMGIGVAATTPIQCKGLISISAQTFAEEKTIEGVKTAQKIFAEPDQIERLKKYHGDKVEWILSAWIDNWLSPAFDGWSLTPLIGAIVCPILTIHGEDDEYGSPAHAERIKQRASTPVTLSVLQGEGHVPHKTSTETVLAAINAFLNRV